MKFWAAPIIRRTPLDRVPFQSNTCHVLLVRRDMGYLSRMSTRRLFAVLMIGAAYLWSIALLSFYPHPALRILPVSERGFRSVEDPGLSGMRLGRTTVGPLEFRTVNGRIR